MRSRIRDGRMEPPPAVRRAAANVALISGAAAAGVLVVCADGYGDRPEAAVGFFRREGLLLVALFSAAQAAAELIRWRRGRRTRARVQVEVRRRRGGGRRWWTSGGRRSSRACRTRAWRRTCRGAGGRSSIRTSRWRRAEAAARAETEPGAPPIRSRRGAPAVLADPAELAGGDAAPDWDGGNGTTVAWWKSRDAARYVGGSGPTLRLRRVREFRVQPRG